MTANRVLVNGSDWVNIIVKNESAIPTDVTLTALANNAEGAVLFKRSFSALAKENAQTVLLPLAEPRRQNWPRPPPALSPTCAALSQSSPA